MALILSTDQTSSPTLTQPNTKMYEKKCQENKVACGIKALLFAILAIILLSIGVMGFIEMGKSENMFTFDQKNWMSGLLNSAAIIGGVLLAWMTVKKIGALTTKEKKEPSILEQSDVL